MPEVNRQMRRRLREGGLVVAAEAKAIAAQSSRSIPPTIKVRTARATVAVIAGGQDAPVAGLFELGNTGGRKSAAASRSGKFRHPVFGNPDVWVEQDMHRFLGPAAVASSPVVDRLVGEALDLVTKIVVR